MPKPDVIEACVWSRACPWCETGRVALLYSDCGAMVGRCYDCHATIVAVDGDEEKRAYQDVLEISHEILKKAGLAPRSK